MKTTKMSDTELAQALSLANQALDAARLVTLQRPSLFAPAHRKRVLFDPQAGEKLKLEQAAWDEEHPGAYSQLKAASDQHAELQAENDHRRQEREHREFSLSVLDQAPRIRSAVEKGIHTEGEAADTVRDWARSSSWCLLLLGGTGAGKSTAAGHFAVKVASETARLPAWVRAVAASRLSVVKTIDTKSMRGAKQRSA